MFDIASGGASTPVADPPVKFYPAVQRHLGLGRSTAEKLQARGDIATFKIGKFVMTRESAIRDFIDAAEARTPAGRRAA